ncbi:MAG: CcmD family protein [Sphingobacteriales bacterium]|nr:MAG: CcmD family protein [Sphingobacteriales bacterium]
MNNIYKSICLSTAALLLSLFSFAQNDAPEMADTMRSNGKIYVVVTVCLLILVGLFIYVARVDRKVSRLEKDMK